MKLLLLAALFALPSAAAEDLVPYSPPSRSFSCSLPVGWTAFEQATPVGTVAHIVGPEVTAGWRPAYHVHSVEKDKPGWRKPRQMLKALRRSDDSAKRSSTGLVSWRVGRKSSRIFEVSERRVVPAGRLPSELLGLHHFYAYIPGVGDDYFVVKLTTRESDYLDYRKEFYRFLDSLQFLGN